MESAGIYWRAVYNIPKGLFEVILVNARHLKNLPGKKTDTSDSLWICGFLRVGLLKGRLMPPKHGAKFKDRGEDCLSNLHKTSKLNYLIHQAGKFGYTLTPSGVAEK